MAKIEVPFYLLPRLDIVTTACCQLIDVELKDQHVYRNLVVKDHHYITGSCADFNGEGSLPFSSFDIRDIRRASPAFSSWTPARTMRKDMAVTP